MSEIMSNVERGLWRIAELGARCSQQSAAGSRGPLWEELEKIISGLDAEFEATRQAVDIAPTQVRSLEGRLDVAKKERDRERDRAEECFADAEAARRERDRERAKAAKAVAGAAEAKATAAECVARATAAQAALDQALTARDEAFTLVDEAVNARDRALTTLDETKTALDDTKTALQDAKTALAETKTALDEAQARIAMLEADLETVRADRDALRAQEAASAGRADTLDTLATRAEGAVVVLPGVTLPDPEVGPIAPAARVSWRPTWSEWANGDDADQASEPAAAPPADPLDMAGDEADDIRLDAEMGEGGVRRYLNVAATIGQLLPDDLGPLLLSGATVIRREGRLFATVAVTADPWAAPGFDGAEQAKKLADAGYRVEWTTDAPLAC